MSSADLRLQKHRQGKDFMNKEDYHSAMSLFVEALDKYGPHVGLLSDLTASLYMLGRMEDCISTANKLEIELESALPLLKKENAARTFLFLGKIYEETANMAKALMLYKKAVDCCDLLSAEVRVQAQAQLLRLQSFLEIKRDLQELYQSCLKLKVNSLYLRIEIEHALILAEQVLFGVKTAIARTIKFLSENNIALFDVRLILSDLLEEGIRQKTDMHELSQFLTSESFKNASLFEQYILEMYQNHDRVLTLSEVNQLASQVSAMDFLRLLMITIERVKDKESKLELQRKFNFILEGLDSESRSLIIKKCNIEKNLQTTNIIFDMQESYIEAEGKKLNLKKNSFAFTCFENFSNNRNIELEIISKKIFGFSADSDLYDRIRISFWRLNKELGPLTGLNKAFLFSKKGVELNPLFTLIRKQ